MSKEVTISEKGQITLPKELRTAWGVQSGDRLVFTALGDGFLVTPKSIDFNDLAGFLGAPPRGPATLEQIDETVTDAAGENAIGGLANAAKKSAA